MEGSGGGGNMEGSVCGTTIEMSKMHKDIMFACFLLFTYVCFLFCDGQDSGDKDDGVADMRVVVLVMVAQIVVVLDDRH